MTSKSKGHCDNIKVFNQGKSNQIREKSGNLIAKNVWPPCICIDIQEIWFGIANGQISSNFCGVICPRHAHILFPDDNLVNKGYSPDLLYALTLRRSGSGIANGQFRQIFTELSARGTPIFSFLDDNFSK